MKFYSTKYLSIVFQKISSHFIEEICIEYLELEDSHLYILEKLTDINDIMRAKLIDQIQEYEISMNQDKGNLYRRCINLEQDPNDLIIKSHSDLFEALSISL